MVRGEPAKESARAEVAWGLPLRGQIPGALQEGAACLLCEPRDAAMSRHLRWRGLAVLGNRRKLCTNANTAEGVVRSNGGVFDAAAPATAASSRSVVETRCRGGARSRRPMTRRVSWRRGDI